MSSVKRQIGKLDDVQLQCRTVGHSWSAPVRVPPRAGRLIAGGIRLSKECTNGCGCTAEAVWTHTGRVVARWAIDYPDGYLIAGMTRGEGREPFRAAFMARSVPAKRRTTPRRRQAQRRAA